jgi:hypothetical protein
MEKLIQLLTLNVFALNEGYIGNNNIKQLKVVNFCL